MFRNLQRCHSVATRLSGFNRTTYNDDTELSLSLSHLSSLEDDDDAGTETRAGLSVLFPLGFPSVSSPILMLLFFI